MRRCFEKIFLGGCFFSFCGGSLSPPPRRGGAPPRMFFCGEPALSRKSSPPNVLAPPRESPLAQSFPEVFKTPPFPLGPLWGLLAFILAIHLGPLPPHPILGRCLRLSWLPKCSFLLSAPFFPLLVLVSPLCLPLHLYTL